MRTIKSNSFVPFVLVDNSLENAERGTRCWESTIASMIRFESVAEGLMSSCRHDAR